MVFLLMIQGAKIWCLQNFVLSSLACNHTCTFDWTNVLFNHSYYKIINQTGFHSVLLQLLFRSNCYNFNHVSERPQQEQAQGEGVNREVQITTFTCSIGENLLLNIVTCEVFWSFLWVNYKEIAEASPNKNSNTP